jgi:hypothetical protein
MEHENGEQQIVAMAGLDWADKEHVIRLQKGGLSGGGEFPYQADTGITL